jgi:hypothetical protein
MSNWQQHQCGQISCTQIGQVVIIQELNVHNVSLISEFTFHVKGLLAIPCHYGKFKAEQGVTLRLLRILDFVFNLPGVWNEGAG